MLISKAKSFLLFLIVVCMSCSGSNQGRDVHRIVDGRTSAGNGPVIYLALGDSTGTGLGARMGGGYPQRLLARIKRSHPNAHLINQSKSGAMAADVLREQIPSVLNPTPTIITLGVGTNDLLTGVQVEKFANDMEEIALRLKPLGGRVIFMTLPDISLAPALPPNLRETLKGRLLLFNERMTEIARRHDAKLVDLYEASARQIPLRMEMFSADGIHPSDEGYEFWADTMWTFVKEVIPV